MRAFKDFKRQFLIKGRWIYIPYLVLQVFFLGLSGLSQQAAMPS